MEGLKLDGIVDAYDCVFLDASVIAGTKMDLADKLYEIRFPNEIAKYAVEIASTTLRWDEIAALMQKRRNVYMTTAVKEEVGELRKHLAQCESYNRRKWEYESKRLKHTKKPFILPHGGERRGQRWKNRLVENALKTAQEDSWSTIKEEYDAQIDKLNGLVVALDGVLQGVQIYDPQGTPNVWHVKASLADRELVAALIHYVQQPTHSDERGTVVTRDGDLIGIFYQVMARLPPDVRNRVNPRVDLYFYPPLSGDIAERRSFDPDQWDSARRSHVG